MQCPPAPAALVTNHEASRSRCSSFGADTGSDTPPLSISGGSSVHSGLQYSIDVAQLNALLYNPSDSAMGSGVGTIRACPRPRGQGHVHRMSFPNNRLSIYETIEEESGSPPREPAVFKAPEHGKEAPLKMLEPAVQIMQWDNDT